MNKIENNIKKLNQLSVTDLDERINLIKTINSDLVKEKKKYINLLNNFENCSESKKFKNKSLNELLILFDKSNLDDKIKIYKTFSNEIDKVNKELFKLD